VPGFTESCVLATFPMLANWVVADFALASLLPSCRRVRIVVDHDAKPLALALAARWKHHPVEVHVLENGLAGLQRLLAADEAERLVVGSLSAAWLLDRTAPGMLAEAAGASVAKASLGRTPVELYGCRRDRLLALLETAAPRLARARRSRELLFEGVLGSELELIEELPGELLFLNDPTDLHRRTLALASHAPAALRPLSRLPETTVAPGEARIAEKARVLSSWVAPGADVEGTVEGSVVFPGASVRRGAHVVNSVLMNGVVVGAGATVQNVLALPFDPSEPATRQGARTTATIGDRCAVGSRASNAVNAAFPEQIRDGLTVIGMGVQLPAGLKIEAGCLVGPGAGTAGLRRLKTVRRGQTVAEAVV
jgi:carbonic anhydrase/acetyltransferase-like protein (isoleucine patch superfamily)